jgi:hypothetical protein
LRLLTSHVSPDLCISQVIKGISLTTFNSNTTLYANTLVMSIAACMDGVAPSNIIKLMAASSVSSVSVGRLTVSATGDAISTSYEVSVHNAALSYSSLSSQLSAAVTSGAFDDYVGLYSAQTGATGLQGTTSSSVDTEDLAPSDDDNGGGKKGLSSAEIAGIVLGAVAGLLALCVGVWLCLRWRNTSQAAAPQRTSRTTDSSAASGGVTVNPISNKV